MISIVLYGRNDSYGYNLHKRAALGMNCMAELLTDADDEILFVDYNTPDDFPTFPEAISDTLTANARQRLRVLRVRPSLHARFRSRTRLHALEPIARNIAVRRSNPANRWILSTNTDMIFVTPDGASLTTIAASLSDGFYHLPRFELPESLWEGFNRTDPAGVMRLVAQYGRSMCLNEVVYGSEYIRYDAPGDFQLILRDDLFAIDGFDEEMLHGWHVDSNIARRLYLRHGEVGDAAGRLLGYHCDHTRQVTPAHEQRAPTNDAARFVDNVTSSALPGQRTTWGCPNERIEEIKVDSGIHREYVDAVGKAIVGELDDPQAVNYSHSTWGRTSYDARHVLPFLVDLFASLPRHINLGWLGGRVDRLAMFCSAWERLGFTGRILIDRWAAPLLDGELPACVQITETQGIDQQADTLVFDFGAPPASALRTTLPGDAKIIEAAFEDFVGNRFVTLAGAERIRVGNGAPPRRFVCIDSIHNRYETLVRQYLAAATAPFSTRLRHGFVHTSGAMEPTVAVWPPPEMTVGTTHTIDLLPLLRAGDGGSNGNGRLVAPFGRRGYVCRGPSQILSPGNYRADFRLTSRNPFGLSGAFRPVILDAVIGAERIAEARARFIGAGTVSLTFQVPHDTARRRVVEIRIFRGRYIDFVVESVTLTRFSPPLALSQ